MDMLVFPGTARLLGDQLFQGPLSYTLANQAKLYSGYTQVQYLILWGNLRTKTNEEDEEKGSP